MISIGWWGTESALPEDDQNNELRVHNPKLEMCRTKKEKKVAGLLLIKKINLMGNSTQMKTEGNKQNKCTFYSNKILKRILKINTLNSEKLQINYLLK